MLRRLRIHASGGVLLVAALAPMAASAAEVPAPAHGEPTGRIAFSTGAILPDPDLSGHSQVFTVSPDGTDVRQLTQVPSGAQAGDPAWSPDGLRIAYVSNESGNFELWLMNADGTNQQVLSGQQGWDYFTPAWSPDGGQLAVTRCNARFGFDLYCDIDVMNADGTGRHRVVGGHHLNADPQYSHDGSQLAFDSNRAGLISAVWLVSTSGVGLRRVSSSALEGFYPQWSPDDKRILFTSNCCRPGSQLFEIGADGSQLHQLTHFSGGHEGAFASYSPDGTQVVFVADLARRPSGLSDLYTMPVDGSAEPTRIVAHHPRVTLSDWGLTTSATSAANAALR